VEEHRPADRTVLQPEDVELAELVLRRNVGEPEVVPEVRRQAETAGEDRQREPETIWLARSVIARKARMLEITAPRTPR
jgi:hypothetical protein